MFRQRILKELSKLSKQNDANGIFIDVNPRQGDNYDILSARIIGPENTPYHNGIFHLEIYISDKYPFSPPSIKFINRVYHPNIDDVGRICLDLIKMPPTGTWRPTIGVEGLLIAIRMLLESPNPDDPLMPDIAYEYKNNRKLFNEKALEYTKKYSYK